MTAMTDFSELKASLDEHRVSSGESVRHLHSHDESFHAPSLPVLFTGSEGTLGIITKATLKLAGLPMNFMAVRVLNADRNLALEENPTLLMEFSGYSRQGLAEEMAFVEEICRANGALSIDQGIGAEERARLWKIRHHTYESIKRYHTGLLPLIMDVAVPLSRYSEMVDFSKNEVRDLTAYLFGHAGDGNIHVHVMDDPQDAKRWARVEAATRSIVMKALEFEGTCTGEHGIGIGKSRFMQTEHGASLALMKRLKALLDPENLFNPGKFFL